jgi:hypothetical protein
MASSQVRVDRDGNLRAPLLLLRHGSVLAHGAKPECVQFSIERLRGCNVQQRNLRSCFAPPQSDCLPSWALTVICSTADISPASKRWFVLSLILELDRPRRGNSCNRHVPPACRRISGARHSNCGRERTGRPSIGRHTIGNAGSERDRAAESVDRSSRRLSILHLRAAHHSHFAERKLG